MKEIQVVLDWTVIQPVTVNESNRANGASETNELRMMNYRSSGVDASLRSAGDSTACI